VVVVVGRVVDVVIAVEEVVEVFWVVVVGKVVVVGTVVVVKLVVVGSVEVVVEGLMEVVKTVVVIGIVVVVTVPTQILFKHFAPAGHSLVQSHLSPTLQQATLSPQPVQPPVGQILPAQPL
jgi:hypothetical protein